MNAQQEDRTTALDVIALIAALVAVYLFVLALGAVAA